MRYVLSLVLFCWIAFCLTACQKTDQVPVAEDRKEVASSPQNLPAANPASTMERKKKPVPELSSHQEKIVLAKADQSTDVTPHPSASRESRPVDSPDDGSSAQPSQDRIVVAQFNGAKKGAPAGWIVEVKEGTCDMAVTNDGDGHVLHLVSKASSFGVKKEAKVDVREYPYLNWRWKAVRIPAGGDVRNAEMDDQALQLYLAFPAVGWPAALNSPVIGYIWDCESPRGYTGSSKQIGGSKLRYVVLRNKKDKTGQWRHEKRNVYQDYKKLFRDINNGEPDGFTQGIQIHINSQHTGTEAEGYFGEIFFSKD